MWVKPGHQLQIRPDSTINWLRYSLNVTVNSFTREYSLTPATTSPGTGGSTTGGEKKLINQPVADSALAAFKLNDAFFNSSLRNEITDYRTSNLDEKLSAAREKTDNDIAQTQAFIASVEADRRLIRLLTATYRQNIWPHFKADQLERSNAAQEAFGLNATHLTAREMQEAPQEWQDALAALITKIAKDTTIMHRLVQSNDATLRQRGRQVSPTLHNRQHRVLLEETIQKANEAIELATKTRQKLQTQLQSTAVQQERAVLSEAFVQLRDAQAPPLPDAIVVPRDKDEVDVEVKLVPQADYAHPPGQSPRAVERTVRTTLFIAPRFRVSASVGPYVSGLVDETYSLAEDSMQVGTNYKRRKRIVRENGSEWYSYTGVTVLTHFEHHSRGNVSWAGTLGAGAQADGLRILVGGSILVGEAQRFVVSTGVALGRVTRLSNVYSSDPNDPRSKVDPSISVVPTRQANAARLFGSITYNLSSARK